MKQIMKQIKKHGYDHEEENGKLTVEIWWANEDRTSNFIWVEIRDLVHWMAVTNWGPTLHKC